MQYVIRLDEPCEENWNEMTPKDNGRHCAACCKTVVDFTGWEPADIVQYIKDGQGSVCGRFKNTQLNTAIETPETLAQQVIHAPVPFYRKVAAVIIILFGISVSSCTTAEQNENTTAQNDTTKVIIKNDPLGKVKADVVPSSSPVAPVDTVKKCTIVPHIPKDIEDRQPLGGVRIEPIDTAGEAQGKYRVEVKDSTE